MYIRLIPGKLYIFPFPLMLHNNKTFFSVSALGTLSASSRQAFHKTYTPSPLPTINLFQSSIVCWATIPDKKSNTRSD